MTTLPAAVARAAAVTNAIQRGWQPRTVVQWHSEHHASVRRQWTPPDSSMPIHMTDIIRELEKDPPVREPSFGPGPLPGTFLVPAAELDALLAKERQMERLLAFLGQTSVETSFSRGHSSVYPVPDPWIVGYSIETEHDGCYRFERLAEGPDRDDVLARGLDAWDKTLLGWQGAEIEED